MINRILGELLYRANTAPWAVDKDQFFLMKKMVLRQHGRLSGRVTQQFPGEPCDACDQGRLKDWRGQRGECFRCHGTGWYKPVTVARHRSYTLGRRRFLVPEWLEPMAGSASDFPDDPMIYGPVHYEEYVSIDQAVRATYWLGLIWDRDLAREARWRLWGTTPIGHRLRTWCRPCVSCKQGFTRKSPEERRCLRCFNEVPF